MIKISNYVKLLLKEQIIDNAIYKNIITSAIVSIFDIDKNNINTEIIHFAKNANFYHNYIMCSSTFDYKNKKVQIKIALYHQKVPYEEIPYKKDIAGSIKQLNAMPHVDLTKQMLQKRTHLLSFDTSCVLLKPEFFDVTKSGDNIKTNTIGEAIKMCKMLIDAYLDDGFDGDGGDDSPTPSPITPQKRKFKIGSY